MHCDCEAEVYLHAILKPFALFDQFSSLISATDHFAFSYETSQPSQYLSIIVHSINPAVKSFMLRLNSADYGELKDRLQAPIRNARNIVIHQSLSDKFLDAFKEQVKLNQRVVLDVDVPVSCCSHLY